MTKIAKCYEKNLGFSDFLCFQQIVLFKIVHNYIMQVLLTEYETTLFENKIKWFL